MQPGAVVADRFVIEHLSGAGGMGTVYRARDRASGEMVAVKVLQQRDVTDTTRFAREVSVLAELGHPAIVRYVAHGATPTGDPFLAMEWIEGEDLSFRLGRGPLDVSECVRLLERVAGALAATHARGIVHRDVKPSNVFLPGGRTDQAKLLDFGLARLARANIVMTREGALVGTPGYMAPEQARGDRHVDARADVFALGSVLHECLTGQPPFWAETIIAVLAKILFEDAPRVSELKAGIPENLEDLVARMLAKDPAARPADGGELLREIAGLATGGRVSRMSVGPQALTRIEHRVVSVAVAYHGPGVADPQGPTMVLPAAHEQISMLRSHVEDLGGRLEGIADGSLVATFMGSRTATDQARQAARATLHLQKSMPGIPLALATGRGVVQGRLAIGEAIDRAALLARSGRAEKVRIDDVTAGLLDVGFDVRVEEGGFWLAGERERIDGVRTLLGRASPCVGRDREIGILEGVLDECVRQRAARSVLVTAAAGVGKSRLRHELVRRIRERGAADVQVWMARGDPLSAGSPFALIGTALRRIAGILSGEPPELSYRRLLNRIGRYLDEASAKRFAELLGEITGVPPFRERVSVLPADARRDPVAMGDQMRRAFATWIEAECNAQPLLLILDDLHWGDLASLRLVDAALRHARAAPLMVLGLARPDVYDLFPALWSERGVLDLRLNDLSRSASERLVKEVLGDAADEKCAQDLAERAQGNAFYLEELIRAVADGRLDQIPETVRAMMQARLEALPADTRRVLRAASVFGGSFWESGVAELLGGSRRTSGLTATLLSLCEVELIAARTDTRFAGQIEYVFRHALVRDASYGTLTDSDRALGHKLAARWLELTGETDAGTLAEHLERAGESARAVAHYVRAAQQALEGSDLAMTLSRAARGVACGASGTALGVLLRYEGEAHRWIGDNSSAKHCTQEAMRLLPPGSEPWYAASDSLAVANTLLGERAGLTAVMDLLLSVAPEPAAAPARLMSWARAGVCLRLLGDNERAEHVLARIEEERKIAQNDASDHPGVAACVFQMQAIDALVKGNPARFCELHRAAAWWFDQAGDARSACETRGNVGYALMELGAYDEAEQALREVLDEAQRIGLPWLEAITKHNLGLAMARRGAIDEGLRVESEALSALVLQGNHRFEGASRIYMASILALGGQLAAAEAEARRAIELFAEQPGLKAFSRATLAEVLLRAGRAVEALSEAEASLAALAAAGDVEEGESLVRLVHAQALAQVGRFPEAQQAIGRARARLLERAARIDDEGWRHSFLTRVPESARTMAIAAEWLGDGARPHRA